MPRSVEEKHQQFVHFFGGYLLAKGLITTEELERAYSYQQEHTHRFGEFAIQKGYLTAEQVEGLFAKQRETDAFIGELAMQEGLLDQEQLDDILFAQTVHSTTLGEALLAERVISPEIFASAMEEYTWLEEEKQRLLWEELATLPESDIIPAVMRSIELAFLRFAGKAVKAERIFSKESCSPPVQTDGAAWALCYQVNAAEWLQCSVYFQSALIAAIQAQFGSRVAPDALRTSTSQPGNAMDAFIAVIAHYLQRGLLNHGLNITSWNIVPNPAKMPAATESTCLGLVALAPPHIAGPHMHDAELKVTVTVTCTHCPCP